LSGEMDGDSCTDIVTELCLRIFGNQNHELRMLCPARIAAS
jgi:hypothetical protein